MVEQFTYEAKNGLLLRNGKPFFWTSDGSSLGGVHSTPLGMWLSRLHGATLVSMPHSSCIVRGAEQADGIHLSATIDESYFSWLREAIRLGFLTQAPEGFFHPAKSASLPRLLAKCPHLLESIYDHGHYMGADPGSDLGLKLLDAKRSPLFTFFFLLGCFAVSRIAFTCPPAPPVVVQEGIKLTKCVQTSRLIDFEWETKDDRIGEEAVYLIQEYLDGKWQTVKEATEKKYRLEGFTIDRMRKYRIVTSVTEGEK
ncbi:MAG: hypothetical protein E7046_11710 [Lentisphaerae bacterium]|nr:hypothetical protein [Lentisphaerota bacterium]